MAFKKLEGHSSLFSSKSVSPAQFALAQEISEANGGPLVTRKNLKAFHLQLRGKLASPYFIAKNVALKVKGSTGVYDLSRLKIDAKLAKADMVEATETPAPTEGQGAVAKKKTKSKKETAKREPRTKKELPAPVVDESIVTVPETLSETV